MERISCDVLVVGGGGAGMTAAVYAARHGARTVLVSKGKLMRSGATVMAPGALAAVDDRWKREGDSIGLHERDTLAGGEWLNNQELVRQMARRAGELVLDLERMGALFSRTPDGGTLDLRIEGGHSFYRSPYMENRVGRELTRALAGEVNRLQIPVREGIMITELLIRDGGVCGAVGFSLDRLEPWVFECSALILATGGAGMVYGRNDNSADLTGDGYALALRAGAPVMDMEFVQAYPLGFLAPAGVCGVLASYPFIAHLYNQEGERFMGRYDPRLELTTRDRLSRAILTEVEEGRGSPRGGVWCDLTHLSVGAMENQYPALLENYRVAGIDPSRDRFEVAPTCHFFMGGVWVDANWQTSVDGLYSVGEAAAGVHGANRVGQNALTEMLVSAAVAGEHAAAKRARPSVAPAEAVRGLERRLEGLLGSRKGIRPAALRARLGGLMQRDAFVLRSGESLREALAGIEALAAEPVALASGSRWCNREVLEAMENENLLLTARCIVTAALLRTESRGAHYRRDYPARDDARWLKNILLTLRDGGLEPQLRAAAQPYYRKEDGGHV